MPGVQGLPAHLAIVLVLYSTAVIPHRAFDDAAHRAAFAAKIREKVEPGVPAGSR